MPIKTNKHLANLVHLMRNHNVAQSGKISWSLLQADQGVKRDTGEF
jgi:hypothetical protein